MGTISRPNTYTANTTISPSEVNDDLDTIYNEFNGSISAANLATNAITTAKITDANVTTAKIADSNVTTAKLADESVTSEKLTSTVGFYATTTQSMPDNTTTDVTTYTEVADYGADFNPATGVFTAPVAGLYHFETCMACNDITSATDGRWQVFISVNGTNRAHGFVNADTTNSDPAASVSLIIPLAASDTVIVNIANITGGAEALNAQSHFSGYLVGQV